MSLIWFVWSDFTGEKAWTMSESLIRDNCFQQQRNPRRDISSIFYPSSPGPTINTNIQGVAKNGRKTS